MTNTTAALRRLIPAAATPYTQVTEPHCHMFHAGSIFYLVFYFAISFNSSKTGKLEYATHRHNGLPVFRVVLYSRLPIRRGYALIHLVVVRVQQAAIHSGKEIADDFF